MGGLKDELKKQHPFELPQQEAALNVLRTNDFLQADFDRLFRRHGISSAQYNVLRILRGAGGAGLPSLEIVGRMVTRVPDITRLVDRLEAAGFVERAKIAEDRRVVLVRVTEKGLTLLARLDEPVVELHRAQLSHLTEEDLSELNRLLVKARRPE